jgi:hypothetical protein
VVDAEGTQQVALLIRAEDRVLVAMGLQQHSVRDVHGAPTGRGLLGQGRGAAGLGDDDRRPSASNR